MKKLGFILLLVMLNPFTAIAKDELFDFNGKAASLDDFTGKGKWSIVMFWAYDCHVCNQEAHQYVEFHKRHKLKDATVLGISLDGKAHKKEADAYIARHKLNFPNLIGEPYAVAGIFEDLTGADWQGTPTFLIYGPKGELRAQQVGAVPTELIESFMAKEATN